MPDKNLQHQQEEFEVLEAIYGTDFCPFQEADLRSCQVRGCAILELLRLFGREQLPYRVVECVPADNHLG